MKRITATFLIFFIFVGSPAGAATLEVHPQTALFDQPVTITMRDLTPDQQVTLTLTTTDAKGNMWKSHATYHSDPSGTLSLSDTAPFSGTYHCIDPMGLFWSMLPPSNKPTATFAVFPEKGAQPTRQDVYHLTASVDGKSVAHTTIVRLLASPALAVKKIRQGSLYADLYYPASFAHDGHRHPAIIVLGGSEGGIVTSAFVARWLASHGFVALATAWYHISPLPKNMVDVPVEPVHEALTYLQKLPFVNPQAIGAWGGSWGGTLALFAATHFPQIHAVVSAVGPVTIGNGIDRGVPPADYRSVDASPFLYDGKPVPYVTYKQYEKFLVTRDRSLIEKALIPIWKINGPVLFIAGGDDKLASSGVEASTALSILKAHKRHAPFRVLYYPNAGHLIFPGYWPTTTWAIASKYIPVGGTPAGYGGADANVGPETIGFFHHALQ